MNKAELKQKLNALNVPTVNYSLEGKLITDTTVLVQEENTWLVFYIEERGGITDKREFFSEEESCQYFYRLFA